ncbi:hypothetical protein FJ366_02755 [Candidatus Dependentiae bacterium]|nr:hypothetical protein [Candidatus Dependentiae bacterium]
MNIKNKFLLAVVASLVLAQAPIAGLSRAEVAAIFSGVDKKTVGKHALSHVLIFMAIQAAQVGANAYRGTETRGVDTRTVVDKLREVGNALLTKEAWKDHYEQAKMSLQRQPTRDPLSAGVAAGYAAWKAAMGVYVLGSGFYYGASAFSSVKGFRAEAVRLQREQEEAEKQRAEQEAAAKQRAEQEVAARLQREQDVERLSRNYYLRNIQSRGGINVSDLELTLDELRRLEQSLTFGKDENKRRLEAFTAAKRGVVVPAPAAPVVPSVDHVFQAQKQVVAQKYGLESLAGVSSLAELEGLKSTCDARLQDLYVQLDRLVGRKFDKFREHTNIQTVEGFIASYNKRKEELEREAVSLGCTGQLPTTVDGLSKLVLSRRDRLEEIEQLRRGGYKVEFGDRQVKTRDSLDLAGVDPRLPLVVQPAAAVVPSAVPASSYVPVDLAAVEARLASPAKRKKQREKSKHSAVVCYQQLNRGNPEPVGGIEDGKDLRYLIVGGNSKQEVKKWFPGSNGSGCWKTVSREDKNLILGQRDCGAIHDFKTRASCVVEAASVSPSPMQADLLQVQAELRDQFGEVDLPTTLSDAVARLKECRLVRNGFASQLVSEFGYSRAAVDALSPKQVLDTFERVMLDRQVAQGAQERESRKTRELHLRLLDEHSQLSARVDRAQQKWAQEVTSATTISSGWKMFKARKAFNAMTDAAKKIQARARGMFARNVTVPKVKAQQAADSDGVAYVVGYDHDKGVTTYQPVRDGFYTRAGDTDTDRELGELAAEKQPDEIIQRGSELFKVVDVPGRMEHVGVAVSLVEPTKTLVKLSGDEREQYVLPTTPNPAPASLFAQDLADFDTAS